MCWLRGLVSRESLPSTGLWLEAILRETPKTSPSKSSEELKGFSESDSENRELSGGDSLLSTRQSAVVYLRCFVTSVHAKWPFGLALLPYFYGAGGDVSTLLSSFFINNILVTHNHRVYSSLSS